ncbi:ABC-2 family transporter protein [Oceanithermus sp.]
MRYPKIALVSLQAALAGWLEYRADFAAAALTALAEAAGRVVALAALAGAGVLDLEPAAGLVYLGTATLLAGFFSGVVGPNLVAFSLRIHEGTLEFVLLKPADPVFLLLFQTVSVWGAADALAGAALLGWGLAALGAGAAQAVLGALALLLGALLAYLVSFALAQIGFFSVHVHNLVNLLAGLFGAGQYPLRAYAAPLRILLTFVLPVYLAVNLPAEVWLGRAGPGALAALAAAVGLAAALARWLFALGLHRYDSASG